MAGRRAGTMRRLIPEEPHQAGVDEGPPDAAHTEAARILADEAAGRLRPLGFTDSQVRHWAEAFCRDERSGDVVGFERWIADRERELAAAGTGAKERT